MCNYMSDSRLSWINTKGNFLPSEVKFSFGVLERSQISFPEDLFDHRCSRLETGIEQLTPLIVFESGEGFTIIDGCKRFLTMAEQGRDKFACCIAAPIKDPVSAGLLRIAMNCGRALQFREKLLFSMWLKKNLDDKEYLAVMDSLGLDSRVRYCLETISCASSRLIDLVDRGQVDLSSAAEIASLENSDQEVILDLFSLLSFSRQAQREILQWLPELSFRLRKTISEILLMDELRQILDSHLNEPQKIQKIRNVIFNLRFPKFAAATKVWDSVAAGINPDPARVSFQPSEAFEKNRLEIKLTLTDAREACSIFKKLCSVPEESWERLINPALLWSVGPESGTG